MKTWVVKVSGFDAVWIKALTKPAAKYEAWKRYTEAGYKVSLINFRARITRAPDPI